jgi:hypothetical protein
MPLTKRCSCIVSSGEGDTAAVSGLKRIARLSVRSGRVRCRQKHPFGMQHRLKRLVDPHGHGSLRPSFSNQLLLAVHDAVAAFYLRL